MHRRTLYFHHRPVPSSCSIQSSPEPLTGRGELANAGASQLGQPALRLGDRLLPRLHRRLLLHLHPTTPARFRLSWCRPVPGERSCSIPFPSFHPCMATATRSRVTRQFKGAGGFLGAPGGAYTRSFNTHSQRNDLTAACASRSLCLVWLSHKGTERSCGPVTRVKKIPAIKVPYLI